MAEMLKGGVIMDVVTPDQAKIAEDAGAVAVMALERVPADIRKEGGVARMSDPDMVDGIIAAVSIPVMAKCRIGHFAEAQVLQAIGVDYIDESEVLTPADEAHHVDKWAFTVPFVCGATNLGEALRRIAEGAAMIRSKGEAGTGNVVEATRHMRGIRAGIRRLSTLPADELYSAAKELQAPYELVAEVAAAGKLPVVLFTAGGLATPADAAMMMQLGADGVFVGSGMPVFGCCAGMIMLAGRLVDPASGQETLAAIDMAVRRNAFGRQVDSFESDLSIAGLDGGPYRGVFIRAPWAERVGEDAEALAAEPRTGKIVAVRQGPALATAFHPELAGDRRIHELFVNIVRQGS